jgi:hypothetical protein
MTESTLYQHGFDCDESDGMIWDYSESVSFDIVESPHELYLQENGYQYSYPIMFQGGMDSVECEMYYNILDAQQHGGVQKRKNTSQRCRAVSDNFSTLDGKSGPPSILKKSKYTKTSEARYDSTRPRLTRAVSISHIQPKDDTRDNHFNTLRRSNSFCYLNEIKSSNRVSFSDHVQINTIYPIHEVPLDVHRNLWSTYAELEYYRQRAYEVCVADDDDEEEVEENIAPTESLLQKAQVDSLRSVIVAGDDTTFA